MKIFRLFAASTLTWFALSPMAQAIVPAPDGCYPNFTTAEGCKALQSLTTGLGNTALGAYSLFSTSTGSFNTAVGAGALDLNIGDSNTAVGAAALLLNTGTENTATGVDALVFNEDGTHNTANGAFAMFSNTNGEGNSAFGWHALYSNLHGQKNTAVGFNALANSTGAFNTAIGWNALVDNTGDGNTAIGVVAGSDLTTGHDNLDIDNPGVAGESSTVRIGNSFVHTRTFIGAVRGVTTGNNNAVPVMIDTDGQLGTISSSARFKKDIKSMDKTSETILALKPVTFHYKTDQTNRPEFGLIAEEVAQVNPDLVVHDQNGQIYTVRYEAVNAMLLNEFLKEHKKVSDQQQLILQLQSTVAKQETNAVRQQKQIDALSAGLQKVSTQLELSKPATKTVFSQ
jgi:uncharacterized coiled-coil protein SlyX